MRCRQGAQGIFLPLCGKGRNLTNRVNLVLDLGLFQLQLGSCIAELLLHLQRLGTLGFFRIKPCNLILQSLFFDFSRLNNQCTLFGVVVLLRNQTRLAV